jgi:hypothetical protein
MVTEKLMRYVLHGTMEVPNNLRTSSFQFIIYDALHTPACTDGGLLEASPQFAAPIALPASVLSSARI